VIGLRRGLARLAALFEKRHRKENSGVNQGGLIFDTVANEADGSTFHGDIPGHKGDATAEERSTSVGSSQQVNGVPSSSRSSKKPSQRQPKSKKDHRAGKSPTSRLLACPIDKDCKTYGRAPVCTFDGADNMWGVTQHLKIRSHRSQVPFLVLCRNCWGYITSESSYRDVHREAN
jgi:hypothetical protein